MPKEPDKVVLPETFREEAERLARLVAPVTAKVEARVAAPVTFKVDWAVRGAEKVAVPLTLKVSLAPPPKEAFWEEREVNEPRGAFKEEPTMGPVALRERVEILPVADRKLVVMEAGLNEPLTVKLPEIVASLAERVPAITAPPSKTERDLVSMRDLEIRPDKAWIDLPTWRVLLIAVEPSEAMEKSCWPSGEVTSRAGVLP